MIVSKIAKMSQMSKNLKISASALLKSVLLVGLSISAAHSVAYGADTDAAAKLAKAKEAYQHRDQMDAGKKYTGIETAIELLKTAETDATDTKLKIEILTLKSRCIYWLGVHNADNNAKQTLFGDAMNAIKSARALNEDLAEGFYYYALALARWAEAKGILESLSRKKELMDALEATKVRDTLDGKHGDTLDGYGADRVLGRMFYKLPFFAGGNRQKSLEFLATSYKKAPTHLINGNYYAETLLDGGSATEKQTGCDILKKSLAINPDTLDPERIPENRDEYKDTQALAKSYCQ